MMQLPDGVKVEDCLIDVSPMATMPESPPQEMHMDWVETDSKKTGGTYRWGQSARQIVVVFIAMQDMEEGFGHTYLVSGKTDKAWGYGEDEDDPQVRPQPDSEHSVAMSKGVKRGGWWCFDATQWHRVGANTADLTRWNVCLTYLKPRPLEEEGKGKKGRKRGKRSQREDHRLGSATSNVFPDASRWYNWFPEDRKKKDVGPMCFCKALQKLRERGDWQ